MQMYQEKEARAGFRIQMQWGIFADGTLLQTHLLFWSLDASVFQLTRRISINYLFYYKHSTCETLRKKIQ